MGSGAIVPVDTALDGKIELGRFVAGASGYSVPYAIKDGKSGSRGTAYFDGQGSPLYIEYRLDPLPSMVSSFSGRASFSLLQDGALVISGMRFEGEAGILFVKTRFSVSMEFGY